MSELEKFTHNSKIQIPDLIKIAIIHYQFETIHPFLDGNRRVGRLLITLYFVEKQILKKPILYLSDFFERQRTLYYDNLMKVRDQNNLIQWLKFFLVGIIETSKSSIETFDKILKLQKLIDSKLQTLGRRASNAKIIVTYLYRHPLINVHKVKDLTGLSPSNF